MKKIYLIGLILLFVVVINGCKLSNENNQLAAGNDLSNSVAEQQANFGIEKGQTPPDFTITTADGKQLRLSQFNQENKPVLLYFWATWCPFCRQDFSVLKNVYPKYSDKVKILAIDLDTSEYDEMIQSYKNKMGLDGIDFAAGSANILSDYQITHTTTKYAVSKDGIILYKGSGAFNEQQWEVLLNTLASS